MTDGSDHQPIVRIEPDDRLVVLARTLQVEGANNETMLMESAAAASERLAESCLGSALYRHRAVHRSASDAPVWSHVELTYFRDLVPFDAIRERVMDGPLALAGLLRAEILLTTPSSFIMARDWQGGAGHPEWQASLEFIQVGDTHLTDYRNAMRDFCGPAAAKLVQANRFGTFRAMETAAVLYQDPGFEIDWNQIHLCELDPTCFEGFGPAFETALREDSPSRTDYAGAFARLEPMRSIPRWTFNDPVFEADTALGRNVRLES